MIKLKYDFLGKDKVILNKDDIYFIMSCLSNQKFINDINADAMEEGEENYNNIRKESQQVIDDIYFQLSDMLTNKIFNFDIEKLKKLEWTKSHEERNCVTSTIEINNEIYELNIFYIYRRSCYFLSVASNEIVYKDYNSNEYPELLELAEYLKFDSGKKQKLIDIFEKNYSVLNSNLNQNILKENVNKIHHDFKG